MLDDPGEMKILDEEPNIFDFDLAEEDFEVPKIPKDPNWRTDMTLAARTALGDMWRYGESIVRIRPDYCGEGKRRN